MKTILGDMRLGGIQFVASNVEERNANFILHDYESFRTVSRHLTAFSYIVSSETASRPNKRLMRTYHWISLFMSYIKSAN
jgi:hypothetical protein